MLSQPVGNLGSCFHSCSRDCADSRVAGLCKVPPGAEFRLTQVKVIQGLQK